MRWTFRVLLVAFGLGCARTAPDSTPEGALRLWLERMEASSFDQRRAREAFTLLGPEARANLEERARRTSLLTGRRVEPHEMLAVGRFGLRFRPKRMRAVVEGERCRIEVVGDDPQSEQATVRCVVESTAGGLAFRVEPELPELRPLPRRDGE